MKNVLRLLVFAALFTVFALPSYAQDAAAAQTPAATGPCAEAEAKAALYNKFRENFNKSADLQKLAYESGKEYLNKYGTCTAAGDEQITKYIQNWVGKYEKATLEFNCSKAANENPAQAFEACAPWIAAGKDNLKPHLALVGAGIKSYTSGNMSLNSKAAAEARTTLELIEAGKTTDVWAPFATQQDAAAGLRYYIAAWSLETNAEESATQLIKVAQSSSVFAKEPATFQLLGASIYNGELKKMVDEYKGKCEGKDATPECDILLNKVNYALDRVTDAYARAIALSNANPSKYGAVSTKLRPVLATLYKQRHEGQETGLNELIAGGVGSGAATTPNTTTSGTTAKPAAPPTSKPTPAVTPTPKPTPAVQKPPRS